MADLWITLALAAAFERLELGLAESPEVRGSFWSRFLLLGWASDEKLGLQCSSQEFVHGAKSCQTKLRG